MTEMHVIEDRRIHGVVRYHCLPEGQQLVKIPRDIVNCVVYLGSQDHAHQYQWRATGFFVSYPLVPRWQTDMRISYLVTAYHVIHGLRGEGHRHIWLRLNTKSGGVAEWKTNIDDWRGHPSRNVDVAVYPISNPQLGQEIEYGAVMRESFAEEEKIRHGAMGVGPGDEVGLPGLFRLHCGRERNLPIMRVGSIAALPAEPLRMRISREEVWSCRAYLIEARSIKGLSGSPVFVHVRTEEVGEGWVKYHVALLGLMQGHYEAMAGLDSVSDNDMADALKDNVLNTGIGIVVPAEDIAEVLEHPDFVTQRAVVLGN